MDDKPAGRDLICAFERFQPSLVKRAMLLTRDRDEAMDLVQDTFERALRHPDLLVGRDDGGLRWLETTLRNLFIDRWRQRQTRPALMPLVDDDHVPAVDPEAPPLWSELSGSDVAAALEQLPERARSLFLLYHYGGLQYHEIRERLNVPLGTIASRLLRARLRVRALLLARRSAAAHAG
jgi:RNA polymerase sigma-70 factor (ECF subfamily)